MLNLKKYSFFEKSWFTIVMLIVFFPVGIFTMFKYKKFNKVVRTILAVFFGIIFIGRLSLSGNSTDKDKVEEKSAAVQQVSEKHKEELAVVEEKPVEVAQSTKDIITSAIPKSIDNITQINYIEGLEGDRSPVVFIMDMSENLTKNYMLKSAYLDAERIIKDVDAKIGDKISSYQFMFNYPLVDKYGNEEVSKVLSFDYSKETIDKINWDNMYTDKLMDLSENVFMHPALTK